MRYPLKNLIHEKLKHHVNTTDIELLAELNREGADVSLRDLNKVLLQLEILGLVNVRWIGKDRRRIEIVERKEKETPS